MACHVVICYCLCVLMFFSESDTRGTVLQSQHYGLSCSAYAGACADTHAEVRNDKDTSDTGDCENTFLSYEPSPCSPAAETALQPLLRCFSSQCSQGSSSPEECFFADVGKDQAVLPTSTVQSSCSCPC